MIQERVVAGAVSVRADGSGFGPGRLVAAWLVAALVLLAGPVARGQGPLAAMAGEGAAVFDRAALGALEMGEVGVIEGVPVGDERLSLVVERFSVLAPGARTVVVGADGVERSVGDTGLVLLRGEVAGEPESSVFVGVGEHFTHGYIRRAGTTYSISTGPYGAGLALTISDVRSIRFDPATPLCGVDQTRPELVVPPVAGAEAMPTPQRRGVVPTGPELVRSPRGAEIAVETDWFYSARLFGGNTDAASDYIQVLFGAVSGLFERDVSVRLRVSYSRVWAADVDPYERDGDALDQLRTHWNAEMTDIPRTTVHYLTGRTNTPYGGVAYLRALCRDSFGYGLSAFLEGGFPLPVLDRDSRNWDPIVVAHELGHNFGTGHTHDSYSPTIDDCGNGDCTDRVGTIMSYCHTCPGGVSNIHMEFHPRVRDQISSYLQTVSCLTPLGTMEFGATDPLPPLVAPGETVRMGVFIERGGEQLESVVLRTLAGDAVAMSSIGDGYYSAELAAGACGEPVRYWFEAIGSDSGLMTLPAEGAGAPFELAVAELDHAFYDGFESDRGWTISGSVSGILQGRWQRALPSGGDRGEPALDYDGSFVAYLTGAGVGNTDVDGGFTVLTSPVVQVVGEPDAVITYARWYSTELGDTPFQDRLLVEVSGDEGLSWSPLEVVGPGGPDARGGWRFVRVRAADVVPGFVSGTGSVQVRFVAEDQEPAGIVEAAIDAFSVSTPTCGDDPTCGPADFAEPVGALDLIDILEFFARFGVSDPTSDLRADGVYDIFDVVLFFDLFGAGC